MKLTTSEVNDRISGRGFEILEEYISAHTKSKFRCPKGHIWEAKPYKIFAGGGCPECSSKKLSKESINEKISPRGITMIGEYENNYTPVKFECSLGHNWEAATSNILRGRGCPTCACPQRTKEQVEALLEGRKIDLIGELTDGKNKTRFRCYCTFEWQSTVNNIVHGNGCPKCAITGFKRTKPAWIYVLKFAGFIKYGITNNLNQRLVRHKKNGQYEILYVQYCESGEMAINWEKQIKKTLGGRFVTKEQCPDGYTETLSLEHSDHIMNIKII